LDGFGTHETLALLLEQRGSKAKITEKVVKAAARNKNSGKEVMSLLLEQRRSKFKITEEMVEAVDWKLEEWGK
jgi:hypothetical protein